MTTTEVQLTDEQYHKVDRISNSKISDFIESRELFNIKHVLGIAEDFKVTEDMQTGSMAHELILYGELRSFIVAPQEVLTKDGKRYGNKYNEWLESAGNKTCIKKSQLDQAERIADAVFGNQEASRLLTHKEAKREQAFFGQDAATGLMTKAKLDFICPDHIADIKTTVSVHPRKVAASVLEHGYHRQEVFYRRIAGDRPFFFIFVEKEEPYRVQVYALDAAYLLKAEIEIDTAMREIAECYKTGKWESPGSNTTLVLPMPGYANSNFWDVEV